MGYSGTAHLLQNGYVLGQTDNSTLARAAVGISEDGNEVYLLVVDGGDFFYSNGIGCNDLALLMKGCGAHDALAISSGNNVTAVWRNMRSENLFDLLNKPANKGVEAPIAGGILIVQ
jgi:exopolysaccharide biosynthesis protein